MRIAHRIPDTEAEGPGRRYALWTRGCSLRCPGCCNPELFKATGPDTPVEQLLEEIGSTPGIEGISILGGEPTEQTDLTALCEGVQRLGLTVMLYSGLTRDEIEVRWPSLLHQVDLLVDGRYDAEQPDDTRRWIGSTNQQLHLLSDRYSLTDPRFWSSETIEIRLSNGVVTVNGWPAQAAMVRR